MDELGSDSTTYLLLFLVGLFSVAVQSFKLYGTPLDNTRNLQTSVPLHSIPLISLGGLKPFVTGFVCYLMILEILYIVLSSSSVVLELAIKSSATAASNTVGAVTEPVGNGVKVYVPILASQLLVTLSQVKPFSEIEQMIRRMAHHLAGIRQNVYDINDKISGFDFMEGDNDG